jgi:ATP-dependent DNA helicase Q1
VPILGLTATATHTVLDDIIKMLNLSKKTCVLFKASFNRPNICYEVRAKPAQHTECMDALAALILDTFNGRQESGIVYCLSQRETELVAADLCERGVAASAYHANMPGEQRSRVHERWLANRVRVIVATIAFGMGIDKPDVRFVIHHSLSKSLESELFVFFYFLSLFLCVYFILNNWVERKVILF